MARLRVVAIASSRAKPRADEGRARTGLARACSIASEKHIVKTGPSVLTVATKATEEVIRLQRYEIWARRWRAAIDECYVVLRGATWCYVVLRGATHARGTIHQGDDHRQGHRRKGPHVQAPVDKRGFPLELRGHPPTKRRDRLLRRRDRDRVRKTHED